MVVSVLIVAHCQVSGMLKFLEVGEIRLESMSMIQWFCHHMLVLPLISTSCEYHVKKGT